MSKIDLGSNDLRQLGELGTIVKRDTLKLLGTVIVDRVLQGFKAGVRMIVRYLNDDFSSAVPFCERHQRWLISRTNTFDQVAFPMSHACTVIHGRRTQLD